MRIYFTFFLLGLDISIRVRGVKFLVFDQEMDEVLINRPFLQTICFDLGSHLWMVGSFVHKKHVDEINEEYLESLLSENKGLRYGATEDDPIELLETSVATIGTDSD